MYDLCISSILFDVFIFCLMIRLSQRLVTNGSSIMMILFIESVLVLLSHLINSIMSLVILCIGSVYIVVCNLLLLKVSIVNSEFNVIQVFVSVNAYLISYYHVYSIGIVGYVLNVMSSISSVFFIMVLYNLNCLYQVSFCRL